MRFAEVFIFWDQLLYTFILESLSSFYDKKSALVVRSTYPRLFQKIPNGSTVEKAIIPLLYREPNTGHDTQSDTCLVSSLCGPTDALITYLRNSVLSDRLQLSRNRTLYILGSGRHNANYGAGWIQQIVAIATDVSPVPSLSIDAERIAEIRLDTQWERNWM